MKCRPAYFRFSSGWAYGVGQSWLAAELETAWATEPLALTSHEGRTILVLDDPGGEPLNLVLERGREQPLDLSRFLRIAINLARRSAVLTKAV